MLLGFKTQYAGKPTNFPAKILLCEQVSHARAADNSWPYNLELLEAGLGSDAPKLHTLRTDEKHRWHAGRQIDFATGIRTKNYKKFGTATCTGVQQVYISHGLIDLEIRVGENVRLLSRDEAYTFARNDGFDSWDDFLAWFKPLVDAAPGGLISQRLIHWTPLRY